MKNSQSDSPSSCRSTGYAVGLPHESGAQQSSEDEDDEMKEEEEEEVQGGDEDMGAGVKIVRTKQGWKFSPGSHVC